jgi:hypothetical protein
VRVSSRTKISGRQASQAWGRHRRGAGGHRRRLLAFLVTFSRSFFGDVASCGCAPGCSTGLTLRARRGWSGAEFLAGKVRAMLGGIRGDLAAIAATRRPSLSCRHSPFVSCVACGVWRGRSRGHEPNPGKIIAMRGWPSTAHCDYFSGVGFRSVEKRERPLQKDVA